MENTIYIIDRCNYTVTNFFLQTIPGCKVDDDSIVVMPDGKEYSIMPKNPIGIPVQRDLKFYTLEEWYEPVKRSDDKLEFHKTCPDKGCNSSWIYDIGYNVWECGECKNTWPQKSKTL